MSEPAARTRRMGNATVVGAALLCLAAPVPALTQHIDPTTCHLSYTAFGRVAFVVWIFAGVFVPFSVLIDLLRRRWWSPVVIPLCGIVSLVSFALLFSKPAGCADWIL